MRNISLFLSLVCFLSSCGSLFKEKKILVYSSDQSLANQVGESVRMIVNESDMVDISTNIPQMHEDTLINYRALVFAGEPGHKLNQVQQASLERYCQAGGKMVLLGAVLESEFRWPWYDNFVETKGDNGKLLDGEYEHDGGLIVIAKSKDIGQLNEKEKLFQLDNQLNYKNATTLLRPADNRFVQVVLDDKIDEPMELDVTHDGRVVFTERLGLLKMYLPEENKTKVLAKFDVRTEGNYEDGLQGIALDPNHKKNGWVYVYYSIPNTGIQRLSRFFLSYDTLLMATEKKILDVEVQTETCCHSGGSVQFGPDGLLYLSTGDNTNSDESNGYSPIDERPGRGPFDAQKSSGNTHDLRGKILRIKVNKDATYSIPEGNLFPKDGSKGRPEIYVMGSRNPFRISIDSKRNHLYWGEVGPDSGKDGIQGPQSYDEFNRAMKPGNYGWPYFQGNNMAYPDWDFYTDTRGGFFDPERPINESPNNTGSRELPPAQKAMIWYPYGISDIWPILGKGSRSAMAGPVYYSDLYQGTGKKFPSYYDGKLFIYEWSRSWINVVSFDDNNEIYNIEPFLPDLDLSKPIDMEFGPDGAMYILEYGSNYFTNNEEARLSRIEFAKGNRKPIAIMEVDKLVGATPLTVNFSGHRSYDYDGNVVLQYEWELSEGIKLNGNEVSFTYDKPGVYNPKLVVRDDRGATSTSERKIVVGNAPPEVEVLFAGNSSFYFGNNSIGYKVEVKDKEDGKLSDGSINPEDINIQFHYIPQGKNLDVLGEKNAPFNPFIKGKQMIEESDCKSCHDMSQSSIGPSYQAVAERYSSNSTTIEQLGQKIIDGGNGVWGHSLMAAHPQHKLSETKEMVKFILSLDEEAASSAAPTAPQGTIVFDKHKKGNMEASYIMTVSYKDKGANDMPALSKQKNIVVRHPRLEAEDYDNYKKIARATAIREGYSYVKNIEDGSYISFHGIDLTKLTSIKYRLRPYAKGTRVLLRVDSPEGERIGGVEVKSESENYLELVGKIKTIQGVHDLFVCFENEESKGQLLNLDWIEFGND